MKNYHDVPDWAISDAEAALLKANTAAHILGEPTDPVLCIAHAILEERAATIEFLALWLQDQRVDVPAHGWEFSAAVREKFQERQTE